MSYLSLQDDCEDALLCQHCNATTPSHKRATGALEKIRDNHIPNSNEFNQLSQLIVGAQADVTRFNEAISSLRALTHSLERQRRRAHASIEMYHCLQTPIRRLPNEILSDIFHRCAPYDLSNAITLPKGFAPLNLGLVCRRWRDIVLSLKSLWSTISMDLDLLVDLASHKNKLDALGREEGKLNAVKTSKILDVFQTYLQRSTPQPLSIHIQARKYISPHPLLKAIVSESRRWQRATLFVNSEYLFRKSVFARIKGGFPALEELRIIGANTLSDVTSTFQNCPRLHSLTIPDLDPQPTVVFPWSQLQVLTLDNGGSDYCEPGFYLAMLPHCKQLTHLQIDTGDCHLYIAIGDSYSSNLESLSIIIKPDKEESDGPEIAKIFQALTLPSLKHLSIGPRGDRQIELDGGFMEPFHAFISRSVCSLETLSLDNISGVSLNELRSIWAMTPAMTKLKLGASYYFNDDDYDGISIISDELLHSLTLIPHDTSLSLPHLPRLIHLDLASTMRESYSEDALLDMIESRWLPTTLNSNGSHGVACLEHVILSTEFRPLGPSSLSRLRKLRAEGMKVVVDGRFLI